MSTHLAAPTRFAKTHAFALIATLIMITLVAVMVIAFLSNASLERITAKSFDDRARAEAAAQSGLAAALNALVGASGPTDFRFITAVGDAGQPVLVPLATPAGDGSVTPDVTKQRNLYSSGNNATVTLSTLGKNKVTRKAGYVALNTKDAAGASVEIERYAFYVDEGGSRQNLNVQGPIQSATPRPRVNARDPNELPLVTATATPSPFGAEQLTAINDNRGLIFTPPTANQVLSSKPVDPPVDYPDYAVGSAIANLTPEGKPRVNLFKLKTYVDGLTVDQVAGNPRAALVDQLLNPNEVGDNWGGGNLSILTKLTRYSGNQPKQIVANLLDYIDSDLIPTTDNVTSPTYFGVEGRAVVDPSDATKYVIVGHPYINFVGTGLVFNRSSASGAVGGLNSTRILAVIGLVNPWSADTKDWGVFYTKPEIEIAITGSAEGGNLGSNAADYFHGFPINPTPPTRDFGRPSDTSNQMTSFPSVLNATSGRIPPNTGYSWPTNMGSSTNYATNFDILNNYGRQPAGMKFHNLGFKITKLRLKFTDTDGRNGYVQVLDGLNVTPQPMNPGDVDLDSQGGSLVLKFATGAPNKQDFHLNTDPRLNFAAAGWLLSLSTENGAKPPTPQSAINVFSNTDPQNFDFSASPPSVTNHDWYTKTDVTQNFYVKSPPLGNVTSSATAGPPPLLDSAGELGYLHTGIPWESLRFYVTGGEQNGKERDRELLAYTHSGTFTPVDYGTVPKAPSATASPSPAIGLIGGPLNSNTNKQPTLQSVFRGATQISDKQVDIVANSPDDPDATALSLAIGASAGNKLLALPGDFLAIDAVRTLTNAQTSDFNREVLARRTVNVVGNQSTRFTVYSLGEAREKAGTSVVTRSRVNLRAEVELQADQNGRPVPHVLSTAYYVD
jgi:Tfp pilus assembly protein PilX